MRLTGIVVATVSLFPLTRFDSAKFDKLVEVCVTNGKPREQCICGIKIVEKRLGKEFLAAMHLRATLQTTQFEIAMKSLVAREPDVVERALDVDAEVTRECKD